MHKASLFIPLGVFALVFALFYIAFGLGDRHTLPSALLGKPFPAFTATELYEGRPVSRADLLGEPTLVNVWATWCPTCKAEHEVLMQIAAEHGVRIVGINYKDDRALALRWLAEFGNPYAFVIEDADGLLGVELGVYGAPETFLINSEGQIVYKRVGDVNARIWRDELQPRLRALEGQT